MTSHKYKVGQSVEFRPSRSAMSTSSAVYKVVRLLPLEGQDPLYRIKSVAEPFERVAKEHELSSRATA
jgi:hypothetical protein